MVRFKVFLNPKAFSLPRGKASTKLITETEDEMLIHGVSVITEGLVKGHFVQDGDQDFQIMADEATLDSIMAGAAVYADGVKVKANHDGGVADIIGKLTTFAKEETATGAKRISAVLHLFKESPLFKSIWPAIKKIPDTIGLSVEFVGRPQKIGEAFFARCSELFSTDLVTEAAANPTGLFQRFQMGDVDNSAEEQGDDNMADKGMTPEDIKSACEAAITPHIDGIKNRLGAMEAAHAAMKARLDAAPAAPAKTGDGAPNPPDEGAMYARFSEKVLSDPKLQEKISFALQDTAKTLHALGLTPGTGPASSIDKQSGGGKKPEDMTFDELLSFAFTEAKQSFLACKTDEDRSKLKFTIVRSVTMANPAKHAAALKRKNENNEFIGIRVPAIPAY